MSQISALVCGLKCVFKKVQFIDKMYYSNEKKKKNFTNKYFLKAIFQSNKQKRKKAFIKLFLGAFHILFFELNCLYCIEHKLWPKMKSLKFSGLS